MIAVNIITPTAIDMCMCDQPKLLTFLLRTDQLQRILTSFSSWQMGAFAAASKIVVSLR